MLEALAVMTTLTHAAVADMPADVLFSFVRDPRNAHRYLQRVDHVEARDDGLVRVVIDAEDDRAERTVQLRVDDGARCVRWESDAPEGPRGQVRVEELEPGTCLVTATVHDLSPALGDDVHRQLREAVGALTHVALAESDAAIAERQGGGWI